MKYLILAMCLLALPAQAAPKPINAERLVDAIYRAEGGDKSHHPYGILSVKVRNKAEARRVCLNTVRNNYRRWKKAGAKGDFICYLGNVYAPPNVSNDPSGLNRHWVKNVSFYYRAS